MKLLLTLLAVFTFQAAAFAQATADDLKKHIATLQAAITAGKTDEAAKITTALLPSGDRLKKGLSDKAPAEVVANIEAMFAGLPKEPAAIAKLLAAKPGQTEIQVHGSTTEDLATYAEGSVAYKEFPGGAKELATNGVLRPGATYYEVELLEPGKDAGMKYHLFYHDGAGWAMLGPIWRVAK